MRRMRLLLFLLLAVPLALTGCPEGDDDDSIAPPDDDDDDGETCEEDSDCRDFDDGLEICDIDAQVCVQGDRNNSREESQLLSYNSTAELYIAPAGDVDWFRFNGTEGDMLLISTEAAEDPLDTVVIYTDAQGNQIGFNDDFDRVGSVPPDSRLSVGVPSTGTFYISVQDRRSWANDPNDPPDGGEDFQYTISLATAGSGSNVPVVTEPNDSIAEALDWGVEEYAVNYTLGGQINEAGDVDYLRVPVTAGEMLRLYGFPNTGTAARPAVTVLLPDETTPVRTYTGLAWTTESRGFIPVLEDGFYYLQIEDDNGTGGFDHWYYLHAAKNEPDAAFAAEVEPNDSENTQDLGFTSGVPGTATIWGRIGAPGDEDHYTFEGNPGDRVTVTFDLSGHGETTNPVVTLLSPSGDELVTGAWTGDPDVPALSVVPLDAAGTWTARITEADPEVGGGGSYYVTTIGKTPGS